MSADWHTFLEWMARQGVDEPAEAWERFSALASHSARKDVLELLSVGARALPDDARLPIIVGVTRLMEELEPSSRTQALCRDLAAALDGVLAELDIDRPGSLATALCQGRPERQALVSWTLALQIARYMLLGSPPSGQLLPIARLCNLSLRSVSELLGHLLAHAPDEQAIHDARVAFLYASSGYNDVARQLNQELGAGLFADSSPPTWSQAP